ncbi:MAG: hypothetical protein HOO96_13180 [Polyangiaceae bacterium]|nr:hypothetical protein [Polyangiaceae bacterium]
MSNNVSGTSGTSRTCSTQDDDDDRVHNEEMATRQAQRLLNDLNPGRLKESGKLDEGTVLALKAFQRDNHLEVTGKADGPTIAKLEDAIRAKDQQAADAKAAEGPTFQSLGEALLGPQLAHPLKTIKEAAKDVAQSLDLGLNAAQLAPGESYEIKAKAAARVEVGGAESGAAKATCNADGTYTVEIGADVALTAGISLGVGAEASVGAGGKLTFLAKDKEEVLRMGRLLSRAMFPAAQLATGQLPSPRDVAFLQDACTSITLRSTAALKASAEQGMGVPSLPGGSGGEASLLGDATGSVTIKLSHGTVKDIVVEGDLKLQADGRLAAGRKDSNVSSFKVSSTCASIGLSAGAEAHVKLSQHYEVPPGTKVGTALAAFGKQRPGETVLALGTLKKTTKDVELSFESKAEVNISVAGVGGMGARGKLTLSNVGNFGTVASKLSSLDFDGAIEALPAGCVATIHVATLGQRKHLDASSPTMDAGGIKASLKVQATKIQETTSHDASGRPSDVLNSAMHLRPGAPAPKHSQLDTNVQDQRYARVAG